MPFQNTSGVNGNSGTLAFSGGGNCGSTCSGTYAAGTGGTVNFTANTFVQSGSFSGAGTVGFTGATMDFGIGTVNVSASIVNFSSGTIGGAAPGILNFTNPLVWTGGSMCSALSAGTCAAGTNATTNANGGITFSSNTQLSLVGRTLNTAGTSMWSSTIGPGDLLMQNGATINNSGTWDIQNDSFVFLYTGNSNTFNNSGTFQKSGGTGATISSGVYGADGTFNNTGHVSALTGKFNINGGGAGNGSWDASSGAILNFGASGGNGTFALTGPFSGAGTMSFAGDTENITGSYNVTGGTTASGGVANFLSPATVTSIGALTISGGSVNFSTGNPITAPTLILSGGNLAGTDTLTITGATTWSGGNMCTTVSAGSCATPPGAQGATFTNGGITFPASAQLTLNGRTLNTAGTSAWTSTPNPGDLLMQNAATINNSGTWDIQNDSFVDLYSGNPNTFNNAGTFQKSGGTTTTTTSGVYGTDGTFKNTGQVIAKAGNMNFLGTFAQTAGTTSLAGGSIATSTNPLSIQGGSVIGVGTVTGGINNTAGTVAPGTTTPSITTGNITFATNTSGTYAQSGTGAYNVKIGGTGAGAFDTLTATGAVTLGGALNVSLVNGFVPVAGNTFTIVTAASVTNKFGSTNLPALAPGLSWQVSYSGTTVVLSVTTVSSPVANLNPGSLPFPNTIVNTPATIQKVQLQNTGTAPLTITSIVPTGTDAGNYSYTVDATQPCPISPATLLNGTSCMLDIGFTPLSGGTHNNAEITVTDNSGNVTGSTQTVALSGTGITLTSITVAPATNNLPVGVTSQYSATGFYSDGSNQNLTTTATWASSVPTVASISNTSGSQGQAKGLTGGTTLITATQNSVTSNQATLNVTTATHLVISAPGSATSGTPFNVQVFAEDSFNQVVTGYTGTVHFTSSDAQAVLPANTTLTNGTANLSFTLKTQGAQTITGTDTVTSTITGTSGNIAVGSGLATHFVVTAPGIATSGTAFSVNVTALDQFNNVAAGYTGTVHFSSSDSQAILPANATLTSGSGNFQVTLKTVGSQTVTATDTVTSTITGVSNAITVGSGTATHFLVVAPPSVNAGTSFNVSVTALDQFNNPVTGYTGIVHITSSDGSAVLPPNATLTSGLGLFAVTLKTLGSQTVTATDTVTSTITGVSNVITVGSGAATHFLVTAPAAATAGTPITVNVTALDQFNNLVTGYTGTVHFTSTDAQAALPGNTTLTSGTGSFSVTLKTVGAQSVAATDTITSTITGTSGTITVGATTATHLLVSAPAAATAGAPFFVTVTALDQFNNIATGYAGTVHFTSTDGQAVLPANTTLTSGTGSFSVTLKTAGARTVTATDAVTSSITGTSGAITVSTTTATHFLVSAPAAATAGTAITVNVTALDPFNNVVTAYTGMVHVTSSDAQAVLPTNAFLSSGTGSFLVTLKTAGAQTVTATDTVTSTITGTSGTITVSAATASSITATAGTSQSGTINGTFATLLQATVRDIDGNPVGGVSVTFTAPASGASGTFAGGSKTFTTTTNAAGQATATAFTANATAGGYTVSAAATGVGTTANFSLTNVAGGSQTAISSSVNPSTVDQSVAFTATVTASGGTPTGTVSFTANATAIAGCTALALNGVGTATCTTASLSATANTIAANYSGDANFSGSSGSLTQNVVKATPNVGITSSLNASAAGNSVTFTATIAPPITPIAPTGTISFTDNGNAISNCTSVALSGAASATCTTSALTVASHTIAANYSGDSNFLARSASLTQVVNAATLQTITVAPTSASVSAGLTQPFTATGHFSDGSSTAVSVNWSSSNTGIATINASGVATGVAAGGPITITATSTANATISGTAQLTVTAAAVTLQSITVTPANPSLVTNGTQAFIAIGNYSDGSTQNLTSSVVWSSGTGSVATISAGGVATGVSAGGSTISATLGGVVGTTLLTVTSTTAHAYVGDVVSANCCLDVIDTSTNQIVKQIPVTNINEPLGITPDQTRVYVPDNVLSALDVIDTTTNTLVNTIQVGNGTTAVVITPNGKFGYVSDLNDGNVVVFNVASSAVVATIPIGFSAGWITVTPDGASVYAGSGIDGRMAVINTSTNTLRSTLTLTAPAGQPAPGCVTGPTFNPEGTLGYVSLFCSGNTPNGNTVDVLSIPSNTVVAAITVGTGPFESAITPDGSRLYVASAVSNNVSVINTATNTVIATIPMPGHAESIAMTPDGTHVYVANTNAATVSVIQTSTNTVTATIATTIPFGIVIASPPAASAATTLTLTPPNLIFAAQADGTPSAPQTINVKNPGATPVTLTSITLTGPNIGDFHLTNGCPNPPATLGAGASCNLQVTIAPTTNGARTALLTINSTNGIAASTQSAPLSGTGISLVSIAVTPANPSVSETNTLQFTATGTYSDNSTQNITSSVNWTSSSTGIATINASGLATGVAAGGPITITATSGNIFGTTQLTVTPQVVTFPLNITLIGTGTGSVTDNLGSINCVNTAGVVSGTCTANYPSGTIVTLTASATQPSTFGGWLEACSGTGGCSVTMNSAQAVTASFVPPPQPVPVNFTPGTNVSGMAAYDCPSNPNPSPGNPCLDPNAHANSVSIGQVITPFTLTVVATEVPPVNGNGICENGLTPQQDLDCRFKSFFTYQTNANGDTIVPLCYPYANGNCVVYSVYYQTPGKEPDQSMYVGPITWNISFNNDKFSPPAPWAGSTPQLYYDPSNFVVANSPYGTDCTTPMLIGNPGVPTNPAIYCQFVFDITTLIDPTKKVDFLIGGKSKNFSDTMVAFPPVFAPVVTVTTTPDAATVTAGSPIGFTIAVSNSAAAAANNVSLNTPLPGGTNVSWGISPAYGGQGTCSITGAQGSQVLNCAFGTMSPSTNLSVHIQSASSAAGTAISPSTVLVGTQQLLSVGSIVVQPITVTFSGLTASQTIPVGTSAISLAGVIGNGTQFAPSGETVSITINGVTQQATVGSNGAFSLQFSTAGIPVSATPYPITYSYAGDSLLSAATNSSSTLTVNAGGEPVLTLKPLGSGTQNGSFYEDLQVTNTGTGVARNATINVLVFRALTGTGAVTVNTALSPALPDNFGSLNVGASTIVRIYLNVPAGVTRFLMTENGNVGDVASKTFAYSSSQVISY